jgi:hypothetical protein
MYAVYILTSTRPPLPSYIPQDGEIIFEKWSVSSDSSNGTRTTEVPSISSISQVTLEE